MSEEVYAITNIEGYALEMRQAASEAIVENNEDDLDSYISINQMVNLIKSECIGYDDNNRPLLNEDANEKIYESTITWINNVGLAKLAAKNLLECAWDDKTNEMIFWVNKEVSNSVITKKGKTNDKPIKRRNKKKDKGS